MTFIEKQLEKVAGLQVKYPFFFIALATLITLFMFMGLPNLRLEGDINAQMPQGIDAFANEDMLTAKFGGTDTVIVLIYLDSESAFQNSVNDIRDPRVIQTLLDLDSLFSEERSISNIASPSLFFRQAFIPSDLQSSKDLISTYPKLRLSTAMIILR
jgi:predicted RND superfamily exporter protein